MPRKLFLKPRIGLAVWLPVRGRNVLADGEDIVVDAYVERRIADGDLEEIKSSNKRTSTTKTEVTDVDSVFANSGK